MNILKKADEIANQRSEEKERQYGPMEETHEKTAKLASLLCGKEITTKDIYWMKIAMKLAREAHSHKTDNLIDLCSYIQGLENHFESSNEIREADEY